MKKKTVLSVLIGLSALNASFSGEQEFIKKPKEKRFYPSCQQYTEINAGIVDLSNQVLRYLVTIQKDAIAEINGYVNGNKDCFINSANKKERADAYAKKMNSKVILQDMLSKLALLI